jgi:predicted nuclease of predicted toxin-antitoxin system
VIDAQLPPALGRLLVELGEQADHVFELGLHASDDGAIWQFALDHDCAIITKDEDFVLRALRDRSGPIVSSCGCASATVRGERCWSGSFRCCLEYAI